MVLNVMRTSHCFRFSLSPVRTVNCVPFFWYKKVQCMHVYISQFSVEPTPGVNCGNKVGSVYFSVKPSVTFSSEFDCRDVLLHVHRRASLRKEKHELRAPVSVLL